MTFLGSHTPMGKLCANPQELQGWGRAQEVGAAQGLVISKPWRWCHWDFSLRTQSLPSCAARMRVCSVGPTRSLRTVQEILQDGALSDLL